MKKLKSALLKTGMHFSVASGVQGASIQEDSSRSLLLFALNFNVFEVTCSLFGYNKAMHKP